MDQKLQIAVKMNMSSSGDGDHVTFSPNADHSAPVVSKPE